MFFAFEIKQVCGVVLLNLSPWDNSFHFELQQIEL